MQNENLFNGVIPCPTPENCPHACLCRKTSEPKAIFSRQLICFLHYSTEIAKHVYDTQTQKPRRTLGECLNEWLWLNRGTVNELTAAIFDYGEQNRDFVEFDVAQHFLKNTVERANVSFFQKPLALLKACADAHDEKELGKKAL